MFRNINFLFCIIIFALASTAAVHFGVMMQQRQTSPVWNYSVCGKRESLLIISILANITTRVQNSLFCVDTN